MESLSFTKENAIRGSFIRSIRKREISVTAPRDVSPADESYAALGFSESARALSETTFRFDAHEPRKKIGLGSESKKEGLLSRIGKGVRKGWDEVVAYGRIVRHAWGHGTWHERVAITAGGTVLLAGLLLNISPIHIATVGIIAVLFGLGIKQILVLSFATYGIVWMAIGGLITLLGPRCLREHTKGIFNKIFSHFRRSKDARALQSPA